MDFSLPRIFADENAKEDAKWTAKEIGAVAIGVALWGAVFTGIFVATGGHDRNGGR